MNLTASKQEYINEICHIWQHYFLKECERLAKDKPWLPTITLENMASTFATAYMYYHERDSLGWYQTDNEWRMGGE